MTDDPSILMATSIAPGPRLAVQREAMASWVAQGVHVVSINARDELPLLTPHFPDVEFVAAGRTAQPFLGKPLIFINDMLRCLADRSTAVVGIVNSDIRLDRQRGLARFLAAATRRGLVCGPRLDVDSWNDERGTPDAFGFDFFLFEAHRLSTWRETRFCLGQGYWDHWFPLTAILAGQPVLKVSPPVGRHIRHATDRNEHFFAFADEFASLVTGQMVDSDVSVPPDWRTFGLGFAKRLYAGLRQRALSGDPAAVEAFARYLDEAARYVVRFIDHNSEKIAPDG